MKQLMASCPNCRKETLYTTRNEATLPLLKKKEWLCCKSCKLVIETDDLKKMLLTV